MRCRHPFSCRGALFTTEIENNRPFSRFENRLNTGSFFADTDSCFALTALWLISPALSVHHAPVLRDGSLDEVFKAADSRLRLQVTFIFFWEFEHSVLPRDGARFVEPQTAPRHLADSRTAAVCLYLGALPYDSPGC